MREGAAHRRPVHDETPHAQHRVRRHVDRRACLQHEIQHVVGTECVRRVDHERPRARNRDVRQQGKRLLLRRVELERAALHPDVAGLRERRRVAAEDEASALHDEAARHRVDAVADRLHVRRVQRIVHDRESVTQLAARRVALARPERERLRLRGFRADGEAQDARSPHGRGERADRLVVAVEDERAAGVFRTLCVPGDDRVLGQGAGHAAEERRVAHVDPVEDILVGGKLHAAQTFRPCDPLRNRPADNRLLEVYGLVVVVHPAPHLASSRRHRRVDRDIRAAGHVTEEIEVAFGRDGARQRDRLGEAKLRLVFGPARAGHGNGVRERPGHGEANIARARSPRRGDRDRTRTERPGRRDLHAPRLDRNAAGERVRAAQDERARARLADRAAARDRL